MPEFITTIYEPLKQTISLAVPGLQTVTVAGQEAAKIFRSTSIEKINWVNMIEKGKLSLPYCVIQIGRPMQDTEWGLSRHNWRVTPTVHIISNDSVEGVSGIVYVESQLAALQDYILTHSYPNALVLTEGWEMDTSEENPINRSMLDAGAPYCAGSLTIPFLVGFTLQ